MATIVPIVIDADGITGDFASVTAWIADAATVANYNLPAQDVKYSVTIQSTDGSPFNEFWLITPFSADATRFVEFIINGPVVVNFPESAGSQLWHITDPYFKLTNPTPENLLFNISDTQTEERAIPLIQQSNIDVEGYIVNGKNKVVSGINPTWPNGRVANVIHYQCNRQYYGGGRVQSSGWVAENITNIECATGFRPNTDTVCKNIASFDSTQHPDFYEAGDLATSGANASSDASAFGSLGTNQTNLVTADHFTNPAALDFTLKPTSSLIGAGIAGADIGALGVNSSPYVTTAASHASGSVITFAQGNFGGAITGAILTDSNGNSIPLTGVTNTQGNCPAFDTSGQDALLYGTVTLAVSDGTDIATADFELVPAAGYTVVTAANLITPAEEGHWHYPPTGGWASPIVDGDQAFTNDPFIALNADGSKTYDPADITPPYDLVYFTIDATDGVLTQVTETLEAAANTILNVDTDDVITASQTFNINLSTSIPINPNEAWQAFITIATVDYDLVVNSQTATAVNVTAPNDLPVAAVGAAVLTLKRVQTSA